MRVSKNMAYALTGVAAIMWATNGIFTDLARDEGAETRQIIVFASVFALVILLPLIALTDPKSLRIKRQDLLPLLVFSVVTGTFFSFAWYYCLERTSVTVAVILLYAYPGIVTIASVFVLKERLNREKAIALPLTFVGCVLVAGAADFGSGLSFDTLGVLLGAYAAISAAIYYLWGKKFLDRYSANTLVLYLTLLSIPGLVIMAGPTYVASASMSLNAWLLVFALGLFPTTIGFLASLIALRYIEASRASIVASIEPVAAVAMAFVILADSITGLQVAGVGLVFLGVILLRLSREPPVPVTEKPPAL